MFYEAIWINPKEEIGKKIVICLPMVDEENAAWTVLRGAEHEEHSGFVAAGKEKALLKYNQELAKKEEEWVKKNPDKLLEKAMELSKSFGVSIRANQNYSDKDLGFKEKVESAVKPQKGLYPNNITDAGKEIWDEVLTKYDLKIHKNFKGFEDKIKAQWACAIIIYKRSCFKNGIQPFKSTQDSKTKNNLVKETQLKIHTGMLKADSLIMGDFVKLQEAGIAKIITDKEFTDVGMANSRFFINQSRKIKASAGHKSLDIINFLVKKCGYLKKNNGYEKQINSFTSIFITNYKNESDKSEKIVFATITSWLSKEQVYQILDLESDYPQTKVLTMLKKAGRNWTMANKSNKLALASAKMVVAKLVKKGEKKLAYNLVTAFMPHQHPVSSKNFLAACKAYSKMINEDKDDVIKTFLGLK